MSNQNRQAKYVEIIKSMYSTKTDNVNAYNQSKYLPPIIKAEIGTTATPAKIVKGELFKAVAPQVNSKFFIKVATSAINILLEEEKMQKFDPETYAKSHLDTMVKNLYMEKLNEQLKELVELELKTYLPYYTNVQDTPYDKIMAHLKTRHKENIEKGKPLKKEEPMELPISQEEQQLDKEEDKTNRFIAYQLFLSVLSDVYRNKGVLLNQTILNKMPFEKIEKLVQEYMPIKTCVALSNHVEGEEKMKLDIQKTIDKPTVIAVRNLLKSEEAIERIIISEQENVEILKRILPIAESLAIEVEQIKATKGNSYLMKHTLNGEIMRLKYNNLFQPKFFEAVTELFNAYYAQEKVKEETNDETVVNAFGDMLADEEEGTNAPQKKYASLLDGLNQTVVRLAFTKQDGSPRIMYATRNLEVIGTFHRFETQEEFAEFKQEPVTDTIIPIIDLELGKMRKVNVNRIIKKDDLGYNGIYYFNKDNHCWLSNMLAKNPKLATLGMSKTSNYANDSMYPKLQFVEKAIHEKLDDSRYDVVEYQEQFKRAVRKVDMSGMEDMEQIYKLIVAPRNNIIVQYLAKYGLVIKPIYSFTNAMKALLATEESRFAFLRGMELNGSGKAFTETSLRDFIFQSPVSDVLRVEVSIPTVTLTEQEKEFIHLYSKHIMRDVDKNSKAYAVFQSSVPIPSITKIKRRTLLNDKAFTAEVKPLLDELKQKVLSATEANMFDFRSDVLPSMYKVICARSVMRINYQNKKGEKRIIWGTTNKELMEMYRALVMKENYISYEDEQKAKAVEKDDEYTEEVKEITANSNVFIMDIEQALTKYSGRSIIPNNILPSTDKLPNVMFFNPEEHLWYDVMTNPSKLEEITFDNATGVANDTGSPKNARLVANKALASKYMVNQNSDDKIVLLEAARNNTFIKYLNRQGLVPKTNKSIIEPLIEVITQQPELLNTMKLSKDKSDADYTDFVKNQAVYGIIRNAEYKSVEIPKESQKIISTALNELHGKTSNGETKVTTQYKNVLKSLNMYEFNQKYLETFGDAQAFSKSVQEYFKNVLDRVQQEERGEGAFFDGRKLTAQEFEEMLRNHVVYLSFVDSSSKIRRMWGTTNPELVRHYKILSQGDEYRLPTEEEKAELQKAKEELEAKGTPTMQEPFYIYDMELGETGNFSRHVIPIRLLAESYPNIPNVIKFDVNGHDWYTMMKKGLNQKEIISSLNPTTGEVTDSGATNPMFIKEKERVEMLVEKAMLAQNPKLEEEQKLAEHTYRMVMYTLQHVNTWTRYDKMLYQELLDTFTAWSQETYGDKELTGDDLKLVAKDDEKLLLVLQAKGLTTYVNPLFVVSDLNMLIHKDRTKMLNFGRRALTQKIDFEEIITPLVNLVSKRRDVNAFEIGKLVKGDEERLKRLAKFQSQEYRAELGIEGINAVFVNAGANSHLQIIYKNMQDNSKEVLLMSPASLLNFKTKVVYHQRKAKESTLSVFMDSLKLNYKQFPPYVVKAIAIIAEKSFDLRLKE